MTKELIERIEILEKKHNELVEYLSGLDIKEEPQPAEFEEFTTNYDEDSDEDSDDEDEESDDDGIETLN